MNPVFRIHTCVISFFCSFSRYVPPLPISIFISIKEFSTLLVLPSSVTSRLSPEKKTPRFLPFFLVVAGAIFPGKPLSPFVVHHISIMPSLPCSSHQQHGFPVSCSWSHAWRGVPPHPRGAASSSNDIKKLKYPLALQKGSTIVYWEQLK